MYNKTHDSINHIYNIYMYKLMNMKPFDCANFRISQF